VAWDIGARLKMKGTRLRPKAGSGYVNPFVRVLVGLKKIDQRIKKQIVNTVAYQL